MFTRCAMPGATFPPPATCPTVVSLLAPLCPLVVGDIAPLIEYTYANFPADIAIVIYFSLVAAILMCPPHEEMSPSRSPLRNVLFATLGSLSPRGTSSLGELAPLACKKKPDKNQAERDTATCPLKKSKLSPRVILTNDEQLSRERRERSSLVWRKGNDEGNDDDDNDDVDQMDFTNCFNNDASLENYAGSWLVDVTIVACYSHPERDRRYSSKEFLGW